MDRIRPTQTSALIDALRKLSRSKAGAAETDAGSDAVPADLRAQLRQLSVGVDIDSEEGLRTIQPQLLRCILQHEWGQGVEGDPAFAGVVSAVNEAMSRDPRLQAVLREALHALR
ncbi:hypothetical protein [Dyella sp. 2RAB6]|uniref:hypothetical protein n=1 Tax=Dyella sp. 2RAB6 TaxID=3232992 RepID=UPI003F92559C